VDSALRAAWPDFPRPGRIILRDAESCRCSSDHPARRLVQGSIHSFQRRSEYRSLRPRGQRSGEHRCTLHVDLRCDNHRRCDSQWKQQRSDHRRPGEPDAKHRNAAVPRSVERGEHATLELTRARHRDGQCRSAVRAERVRDLEQMTGIFARLSTGRDHTVIAGKLTLDAQPPRDPPRGGMEPVHRAGSKGQRLRQAIVAGDVRQFVKDHGTPAVVRPCFGDCRNEDGGAARAECHRDGAVTASKQAHRTMEVEPAGAFDQQPRPFRGPHLSRFTRQPADAPPLDHHVNQHDDQADHVHARNPTRPRDLQRRRPARRGAGAEWQWRCRARRIE
jgi:hypothetical protein